MFFSLERSQFVYFTAAFGRREIPMITSRKSAGFLFLVADRRSHAGYDQQLLIPFETVFAAFIDWRMSGFADKHHAFRASDIVFSQSKRS